MIIRIIKSREGYQKGDVIKVTPAVAIGLISRGIAKADKMITETHHG